MSTSSTGSKPRISVVVPTFNGQDSIVFVLSNLLLQRYPRDNFELILIDDGSTDRTPEVIALFAEEFVPLGFNLRQLANAGRKGACAARNEAIRVARGEIVAMTDQDVFVPNDWLSQIDAAMTSGEFSGCYGDVTTDFENFVEPLNGTAINSRYLTANVAYRREVLMEVGMFSEEFPFFRGDSDLAYKIIHRGHKIEHAMNVLVYHPLREFQWSSLWGFLKWSTYDALLFKRHPQLAGEDTLRQVVPRLTPEGLSFVLFVALIVVAGAVASPIIAVTLALSMAALAGLTLSFVRSSYRDKPWSLRLKGAFVSLIVYLPLVLGRLAGSIKYRKFIL